MGHELRNQNGETGGIAPDPYAPLWAKIGAIPQGRWVMTTALESKRGGVVVKAVAPAADLPPLISVCAWKGHGIEPLIRDSRRFAVCLVDPEDKLTARKFGGHLSDHADQFDAVPWERLVTGSPILLRSRLVFDCEVVRHVDMEADHEMYIGLVAAAKLDGEVTVRPPDPKR